FGHGSALEKSFRVLVRGEQGLDFALQHQVASARLLQVCRTISRRQINGNIEDALDLLPVGRRHGDASEVSSRRSQARATAHPRFTGAGNTPTTSAVSSMERPPKKRSSTIRPCFGSSSSRRDKAESMA